MHKFFFWKVNINQASLPKWMTLSFTTDKGRNQSRMTPGVILVRDAAQADELASQMRASASRLQTWIASFGGDGIGC